MGDSRIVEGRIKSLALLHQREAFLQVLTTHAYPARHFDEGEHIAVEPVIVTQAVERVDEDIDALVAELITAACRHDYGVVVQTGTHQRVGYVQEFGSCQLPLAGKRSAIGHKVVFKSIGQNRIYGLVQQLLALQSGNVAHRSEAVNIVGSTQFDGMFGLHIEFISHLIAIVGVEILIERLVVSGDASTYTCGMGGEYSGYLGHLVLDVQQTEASHPLIAMIYHATVAIDVVTIEALYHSAGSIGEHRGFVVIAIGMQTIHLIVFPQPSVYIILLSEEWFEVN